MHVVDPAAEGCLSVVQLNDMTDDEIRERGLDPEVFYRLFD